MNSFLNSMNDYMMATGLLLILGIFIMGIDFILYKLRTFFVLENNILSFIEIIGYFGIVIFILTLLKPVFHTFVKNENVKKAAFNLIGPIIGVTSLYLKPSLFNRFIQ